MPKAKRKKPAHSDPNWLVAALMPEAEPYQLPVRIALQGLLIADNDLLLVDDLSDAEHYSLRSVLGSINHRLIAIELEKKRKR